MKLKITYFVLSLLLSIPLLTNAVTLNSAKKFDGSFINGEVVRDIRKYQFDIRNMLLGKWQVDRRRVGTYEYEGNKYSVQELATLEQDVGNNQQLQLLLTQMQNDFMHISEPFEQDIRNAKSMLEMLVSQSNKLRNRKSSILNKWSECSANHERELFETHIQTIQDLKIFLIDVCNFLTDIVESCPKARKQYDGWRKTIAASASN